MKVKLKINGQDHILELDPDTSLLTVLRDHLELYSVKNGCGIGSCGNCTVVVNNKARRSCNLPVKRIHNAEILTIEGISTPERLHPLQTGFIKFGAFQCGYCTPAMIMSAYALLLNNPMPTRDQIIKAINPVLCRCTGYHQIVDAIEWSTTQRIDY